MGQGSRFKIENKLPRLTGNESGLFGNGGGSSRVRIACLFDGDLARGGNTLLLQVIKHGAFDSLYV